jgi:hypothetical protein
MGEETTTEKPAADGMPPMPEGQPAQPGPAADLPGEAESTMYDPDGDSSMLTVAVPDSAKIFVNDKPTSTPGEVRQFVCNLTPGCHLHPRGMGQDGKLVRRQVDRPAGRQCRGSTSLPRSRPTTENARPSRSSRADEPAGDRVTIRLPADAALFLPTATASNG